MQNFIENIQAKTSDDTVAIVLKQRSDEILMITKEELRRALSNTIHFEITGNDQIVESIKIEKLLQALKNS